MFFGIEKEKKKKKKKKRKKKEKKKRDASEYISCALKKKT